MANSVFHLIIRGFISGRLIFEESVELLPEDVESDFLSRLALKHVARVICDQPHMIEMEFLDEPDPLQRFFRFGTDPACMVMPMNLHEVQKAAEKAGDN